MINQMRYTVARFNWLFSEKLCRFICATLTLGKTGWKYSLQRATQKMNFMFFWEI